MKINLLFFLIFWSSVFGQKLKFDVMLEYSTSYENKTESRFVYGISSNDNYFMNIINEFDETQIAEIYDLKNSKLYLFKIIKSKSQNNEIVEKFVYVSKSTFLRDFGGRKVHFDFKKISLENNVETLLLTFYKSKSKSKPMSILELKILKSEANLFPLFRYTCFHPNEFISELNYLQGGLVLSCSSNDGKRKTILKSFTEVNLEVEIFD